MITKNRKLIIVFAFSILVVSLSSLIAQEGNTNSKLPAEKIRWPYLGIMWHNTVLFSEYPEGNILGAPPRSYVAKKAKEVQELSEELADTVIKLNQSNLTAEWDSSNNDLLLSWIRITSKLHKRLFEILKAHPEIEMIEMLIPVQEKNPDDWRKACTLCYMIRESRAVMALASNWSPEQMIDGTDVKDLNHYLLIISGMTGGKGGTLKITTGFPSPNIRESFEGVKGLIRFTFCFNPFLDKETIWKEAVPEKTVEFSKDYNYFKIVK